ncbi:unnamed protein product [Prorocentrum cordatum]|uniref:Uncharacterized protein n=1 Tax=Prorocentrum cordatum TaxID=2364126 RepID=A0ABN9V300_9DINO|nr:unnamed protein product [Polarella glacialis]
MARVAVLQRARGPPRLLRQADSLAAFDPRLHGVRVTAVGRALQSLPRRLLLSYRAIEPCAGLVLDVQCLAADRHVRERCVTIARARSSSRAAVALPNIGATCPRSCRSK